MLRATEHYHLELVVGDGEMRVWVTDHDMVAQPTGGASGNATVLLGSEKVFFKLAPDGQNGLVGKHPNLRGGRDARVILNVNMKSEHPVQVNFLVNGH